MVRLSNHACSASSAFLVVIAVSVASIACGRKAPPLPPLVKLPTPPADMRAERHGAVVDVEFTVPAANTDGTRPANVTRIDVFGLTSTNAVNEGDVIKYGTRVASLGVKAPRDPNATLEPDEEEDVELTAAGLDQGARATVQDRLTAEAMQPATIPTLGKPVKGKPPAAPPPDDVDRPLLAPTVSLATRVYVGVTVTTKGKLGPRAHAVVSMIDTPGAVDAPTVTYTEKAITVAWTPIQVGMSAVLTPEDGTLPATPIGVHVPRVAYNVYEVSDSTPPTLARLTPTPLKVPRYTDARMSWGAQRCYAVRAFVTIDDVSLEGEESAPGCTTLTDKFPPAAPQGLQAVPSEKAISLIWDANAESDIRGYIVLRGLATAETLEPLTPEPVPDTSFQDKVPSGVRYAYAVQAVDAAGNLSPPSARVEETAR